MMSTDANPPVVLSLESPADTRITPPSSVVRGTGFPFRGPSPAGIVSMFTNDPLASFLHWSVQGSGPS